MVARRCSTDTCVAEPSARAAAGLMVCDAADWYAARDQRLAERFSPDWNDAAVAEFAAGEEKTAGAAGYRLVGAVPFLLGYREHRRDLIRQELRAVGLQVRAAETSYADARTSRAGLVARIDAWGDPHDGEDQQRRNRRLGELAAMSPHSVAELRATLAAIRA